MQDAEITRYRETKRQGKKQKLTWINEPDAQTRPFGVLSVGLNDQNDVVALRVMDDPGGTAIERGAFNAVNQVKSEFINELGVKERTIMAVGPTSVFDSTHISRKVIMKPAMKLEKFVEYAKESRAVSQTLRVTLEQRLTPAVQVSLGMQAGTITPEAGRTPADD